MSLWRSTPLPRPPAVQLLGLGLALWLAPLPLGDVLRMLAQLIAAPAVSAPLAYAATVLLFSPLFAWIGWLVALPGAWVLMRAGRFGWLPALALGAVGGLAAWGLLGPPAALAFCPLATLALRAVSGAVIPQAFTPPASSV